MLLPGDEHVYAFTRRLGADALLVLVNLSAAERYVSAAELPWSAAELEGADLLVGDRPGSAGDTLRLAPWHSAVLHRVHDANT
jgi:oligo-1,6-glucosidase